MTHATAQRRHLPPTRKRPHGINDPVRHASPESERALLAALFDLIGRQPAIVRDIVATVTPAMLTIDYGDDVLRAINEAVEHESPGIGDVTIALRGYAAANTSDYQPVQQFVADLVADQIATGFSAERVARAAAADVLAAFNRRQQADRCLDLLHAINDPSATTDEIASSIARLTEASEAAGPTGGKAAASAIVDCLERWQRNETPPRVMTGFSPVDRNLGGGLPVGITAIAAKPKVGKSCLAGQLMLGALLQDPTLTAVWFRGEMSNDQLLCKLLATWSELRHPAIELVTRRQAENRDSNAAAAAADLATQTGGRLSIIAPPLTPSLISSAVRSIRPRLMVIDYVQKVQPDVGSIQRADKRHESDDTTTRISAAALEFNIATLVVSSLPKSARPEDGIGTLAKDSNLLDYEANVFATLWKEQQEGSTLFRINANRDGPEADEQLWFDGNAQFFRPAAALAHEEFAAWSGGDR